MIDRAKVIKGLECCREMSGDACQKCPYISDCDNLSAGVPHLTSDALELLKEQPKWISVEDQMPPEDMRVIGYTPVDGCMFVGFRKTYRYSWQDTAVSYWYILTARRSTKQITKRVTHWMPLPEPPERRMTYAES